MLKIPIVIIYGKKRKTGMKCAASRRLAKRLKDDNDFISVDAHANKLC